MILIRRQLDKNKAYTCIMLPGEEPKVFPTSEYEHKRILEIYKQDKQYQNVINDHSEYKLV